MVKAVLHKKARQEPETAVSATTSSPFFNCFMGESQSTKKSALQTNLLGNNCFCLKKNCSGVVYVVELERTRTLSCSDIPLYNIETRRLVKCNKCFYVSSLQAHKLNSQGSAKMKLASREETRSGAGAARNNADMKKTLAVENRNSPETTGTTKATAVQNMNSSSISKNFMGKPDAAKTTVKNKYRTMMTTSRDSGMDEEPRRMLSMSISKGEEQESKSSIRSSSMKGERDSKTATSGSSTPGCRLNKIMYGIRAKTEDGNRDDEGDGGNSAMLRSLLNDERSAGEDNTEGEDDDPTFGLDEDFTELEEPPEWLTFDNEKDRESNGEKLKGELPWRANADDTTSHTTQESEGKNPTKSTPKEIPLTPDQSKKKQRDTHGNNTSTTTPTKIPVTPDQSKKKQRGTHLTPNSESPSADCNFLCTPPKNVSGARSYGTSSLSCPFDDGHSFTTSSKKSEPHSVDPPQSQPGDPPSQVDDASLEDNLPSQAEGLQTAPSTQSDLIHYLKRVSNKWNKKSKDRDKPQCKSDGEKNDPSQHVRRQSSPKRQEGGSAADPPIDNLSSSYRHSVAPARQHATDPQGKRLREPRGRKKSHTPSRSSKLTNIARSTNKQYREQTKQESRDFEKQSEEEQKSFEEKCQEERSVDSNVSPDIQEKKSNSEDQLYHTEKNWNQKEYQEPLTPDIEAWTRRYEGAQEISTPVDLLSPDARRLKEKSAKASGQSRENFDQYETHKFESFETNPKIEYRFSSVRRHSPSEQNRDEIQQFRAHTPPEREQKKTTISTSANKLSPPAPDDRRKERGRTHRHGRENYDVPANITVTKEPVIVSLPTIEGTDEMGNSQHLNSQVANQEERGDWTSSHFRHDTQNRNDVEESDHYRDNSHVLSSTFDRNSTNRIGGVQHDKNSLCIQKSAHDHQNKGHDIERSPFNRNIRTPDRNVGGGTDEATHDHINGSNHYRHAGPSVMSSSHIRHSTHSRNLLVGSLHNRNIYDSAHARNPATIRHPGHLRNQQRNTTPIKADNKLNDDRDLDAIIQDSVTYLKERYPGSYFTREPKNQTDTKPTRRKDEETSTTAMEKTSPSLSNFFAEVTLNASDNSSWQDLE